MRVDQFVGVRVANLDVDMVGDGWLVPVTLEKRLNDPYRSFVFYEPHPRFQLRVRTELARINIDTLDPVTVVGSNLDAIFVVFFVFAIFLVRRCSSQERAANRAQKNFFGISGVIGAKMSARRAVEIAATICLREFPAPSGIIANGRTRNFPTRSLI